MTLQKPINKVVDGIVTASTSLVVKLLDIYDSDAPVATATEISAGLYEITWDEINSYGVWEVDGVEMPEWGYVWLGYPEQQKAMYLFKDIEMTSEVLELTTGVSPLDTDSEGRTVGTFPAMPTIFITSKQERQVIRDGDMTLTDGVVTIPLCMASVGEDGESGNYFDLAIIINQPIIV